MKVTILGAGAIGSMFGGLLAHRAPSLDVLLMGRGDHAARMREARYVPLDGPWGSYRVPIRVSGDLADLAGSDLVLLCVKSQATEEAIRSAAPYLGQAVVVSIQNGINQRILRRFVPSDRLVMGMTATNIAILEPGSVSLQLDGTTVLGSADGEGVSAAVEQAVAVLRQTGLRVDAHPNVQGVQYNKLTINVLGAASALSASNFITEAILHRPWREAVCLPLLDECIAAIDRAGIRLARIPGVPDVHGFRRVMRLLGLPLVGTIAGAIARLRFDRRPIVFSLYHDLLRRKATEVDFINGEIVALESARSAPAPANALVVAMVHELENRGDGTFFARDEVIRRFRSLAARGQGNREHE